MGKDPTRKPGQDGWSGRYEDPRGIVIRVSIAPPNSQQGRDAAAVFAGARKVGAVATVALRNNSTRPVRLDTVHLAADSAGTHPARDTVVPVIDSPRFLKWAQLGVVKYPNNAILIGQLAQAYSVAGPVDSAVAVTKRLMAVDSSDVNPVLRVAKALSEAKINIQNITTSEIKISCIIDKEQANKALQVVHDAFELEKAK